MRQEVKLKTRLRLLGIDEDTRHNMHLFHPVLVENINTIVERFYDHLLAFPEARKILSDPEKVKNLRRQQKKHWIKMFWCDFDSDYAAAAEAVGRRHYQNRVPPYLYVAGYNFFTCELIKLASAHYGASLELPGILTSATRVVSLDMDLALSAYTREFWTRV